jgi:VIT1/CCC1 family predicted Fe2+/Mn2+ transporter
MVSKDTFILMQIKTEKPTEGRSMSHALKPYSTILFLLGGIFLLMSYLPVSHILSHAFFLIGGILLAIRHFIGPKDSKKRLYVDPEPNTPQSFHIDRSFPPRSD